MIQKGFRFCPQKIKHKTLCENFITEGLKIMDILSRIILFDGPE